MRWPLSVHPLALSKDRSSDKSWVTWSQTHSISTKNRVFVKLVQEYFPPTLNSLSVAPQVLSVISLQPPSVSIILPHPRLSTCPYQRGGTLLADLRFSPGSSVAGGGIHYSAGVNNSGQTSSTAAMQQTDKTAHQIIHDGGMEGWSGR